MMPVRFVWVALPLALRQIGLMMCWTVKSKEHYNHSYCLTAINLKYLGSFVSVVTGTAGGVMKDYMDELEGDEALRSSLACLTRASCERHNCDIEPRYGRRLGWYAMVRAVKPRVVVETGVDRGLGTAVLAAALKRNDQEGYPGVLYATDIVPTCGHLVGETYKPYCRILLGDSVECLKAFDQPVDIFIHDSDHRAEYEWAEYLAIEPRLHPKSLIISDNARQTRMLYDFAVRTDRQFLFFQDEPLNHWWPGDGIGVAYRHPVSADVSNASGNEFGLPRQAV